MSGELVNGFKENKKIEVPTDLTYQKFYITSSEKKAIKQYLQDFPEVKKWAEKNNLPFIDPEGKNSVISITVVPPREI